MEYFAYQWHITDQCDQRCRHCYIFSEGNHLKLAEVSENDADKVIENCREMCRRMNRIPYFYITGGDPLLHPRFWHIIDRLQQYEIGFSILGNPFHLTEDTCIRLKDAGCERYQLSIDGNKKTHDAIRKEGSYDTTIDKLRLLRKSGIRSIIMTTVSGSNINQIEDIIDTVVANKVDIFSFARYCPTSLNKSTHIEPLEYRRFLDKIWNKFIQYKDCGTSFNLKDHLWKLYLYEKGIFKIPDNAEKDLIYDGCNCSNCHLTILPKGEIMACRRFESVVGNALNESLYSIYNGNEMNQYRHYEQFEKCGKCELLRFCRGCPAVAYGYTHNFYASDPQCWKEI